MTACKLSMWPQDVTTACESSVCWRTVSLIAGRVYHSLYVLKSLCKFSFNSVEILLSIKVSVSKALNNCYPSVLSGSLEMATRCITMMFHNGSKCLLFVHLSSSFYQSERMRFITNYKHLQTVRYTQHPFSTHVVQVMDPWHILVCPGSIW